MTDENSKSDDNHQAELNRTPMASASTPNRSNNDNNNGTPTSKSYFRKTVCLKDWWLVKAEKDYEGKRLAVAGIASQEQQARRVFTSAPILRSCDVYTLETFDGIRIIIQGLINKARTVENGFPSEVCRHFAYGFPSYWEIYALNSSKGEIPTVGAAQNNSRTEMLSPQAGIVVPGTGQYSDYSPKDYEKVSDEVTEDVHRKKSSNRSEGGQKETISNLKSGDTQPSGVDSQKKSQIVIEFSEIDFPSSYKSSLSPVAPEASVRETSLNDAAIENTKTLEPSGNSLDTNVRQVLKSSKKLLREMDISREMGLADKNSRRSGGRISAHGLGKVQRKWKDNSCGQLFHYHTQPCLPMTTVSGSEEIGNARANTEKESRGRSLSSLPETGLRNIADEMTPGSPDMISVGHNFGQKNGVSCTDEDGTQVVNAERIRKRGRKSNESMLSPSGLGGVENKGENNAYASKKYISRHANLSGKKARRLFARDSLVTQEMKEESSIATPESLSLKRSRSGRLLLPTLEFWRNQRVIYDVDGYITGIKDLQLNQPKRGSMSEPSRKKRQLR